MPAAPRLCLLPVALALLGWTQAADSQGRGLRWELEDGPVGVAFHHEGAPGISVLRTHGALLRALQGWASVAGAALEFEQLATDYGVACPHGLPDGWSDQLESMCGGDLEAVDGDSVVFFMSTIWPYGEEVIGLTTLTWNDEQILVDADVALNGVDYRWSLTDDPVDCMVDPDRCAVDLESVALHELGHLVGLDHSAAPGAVMSVDYRPGTLKRELTADDIEGISSLYPCPDGDCRSDVASPAGCAVGGGAGLGILLLLRPRRRRVAGAGAAALLLLALPAQTSVVRALPVVALAERAGAVVVADVVDATAWRDGIVWTSAHLRVQEVLRGDAPDDLELVLPGGEAEGWGTLAFGVPRLRTGDRVVAFLAQEAGHFRLVGLGQGVAHLALDGALVPDLAGLTRVAFDGGDRQELPADLDGLRATLGR